MFCSTSPHRVPFLLTSFLSFTALFSSLFFFPVILSLSTSSALPLHPLQLPSLSFWDLLLHCSLLNVLSAENLLLGCFCCFVFHLCTLLHNIVFPRVGSLGGNKGLSGQSFFVTENEVWTFLTICRKKEVGQFPTNLILCLSSFQRDQEGKKVGCGYYEWAPIHSFSVTENMYYY